MVMGSNIGSPIDNRPNGEMELSANQNDIASGTPTKVLLNTVPADFVDGIEDTGNNRIGPVRPGWYQVTGRIVWNNVPAETRLVAQVKRTGATIIVGNTNEYSVGGSGLPVECSKLVKLAANAYLELEGIQNSGVGTVDIRGGARETFLQAQRIR